MDILSLLDELQIIARNGLHYTQNPYDRERYERLMELTTRYYGQALDLAQFYGVGTLALIIFRLDSSSLALQLPVTARHAAQPGTAFNWLCYHDTMRSVGSIWLCSVGDVLVCLCHTPSPPRSLLSLYWYTKEQ